MFQGEVNAVSGADLEGLERRNAGLCSPFRRTAAHAGYLGHRGLVREHGGLYFVKYKSL